MKTYLIIASYYDGDLFHEFEIRQPVVSTLSRVRADELCDKLNQLSKLYPNTICATDLFEAKKYLYNTDLLGKVEYEVEELELIE